MNHRSEGMSNVCKTDSTNLIICCATPARLPCSGQAGLPDSVGRRLIPLKGRPAHRNFFHPLIAFHYFGRDWIQKVQ
ncbi:MAG: hypothetical protein WBP08_06195 [Saprospiraceae bacterium]